MASVYALIDSNGALQFRDGVPCRMLGDTDSSREAPAPSMLHGSWFTIARASGLAQGLCAHADDTPGPANHIGQRLLAALGGTAPEIRGNLAICGTEVTRTRGTTVLCGLNPAQQRVIQAAHARATAHPRAGAQPPGSTLTRRSRPSTGATS